MDISEVITNEIKEKQIIIENDNDCVSKDVSCVSKSHIRLITQKIAGILAAQGVPCCECSKTQYKLYRLSDCKEPIFKYSLEVRCPDVQAVYQFELAFAPSPETSHSDGNHSETVKGRYVK